MNMQEHFAADARAILGDERAEWGEPDWSILDDRRGKLPEFPEHVFSEELRTFVSKTAAQTGITFAHVAVPLLSITSGLIGASRFVQPVTNWREPCAVWAAI